jgi:hypothetical protein
MNDFAERHFRSLIFAIWLAVSLLLYQIGREFIADWKMGDPDDQLRLVQVRDWLAGQSWWDITQYRMNQPDGGPMHWSRLVDVPIALAILALRPFLGMSGAEHAAAVIVPLLTFGVVMAIYATVARRLFGPVAALVATMSLFMIWPVRAQLVPLRIDHHGWQIVMFLIAMLGLFDAKRTLRSAVAVGAALALWIEISVEGLPFAVLFLGLLALEWLLGKRSDTTDSEMRFPAALAALAVGSAICFSITENWLTTGNFCDSLSPFHIAAFGSMAAIVGAGALWLQAKPVDRTLIAKLVIGAAAVVGGAASWWLIAPQCVGDAFGALDPLVRKYWYVRVYEGLPLWSAPRDYAAAPIIGMLAGLLLLMAWVYRSKQASTRNALLLTLLYLGCLVAGVFVIRTTIYALLISGMLVGWGTVALFNHAENGSGLAVRMGMRTAALLLAMTHLFGQNISVALRDGRYAADTSEKAEDLRLEKSVRQCQRFEASQALDQLPPSRLMVALDSSPSILQFTRHAVVATGHHRNDQAMADVIRTFTSDVAVAESIFRNRKIEYLVTCPGSYELRFYANEAPAGFAAALDRGEVPRWLVPQADIGPFHIWRVDWTRN